MTQRPAEHCGDTIATAIGQLTIECILRPGHSGSHADENGTRWRLTAPTQADTCTKYADLTATIGYPVRCPHCGPDAAAIPPTHWTKHVQRHHPEAQPAEPDSRYARDIEVAIGLNAGGTGTEMVHAVRDAVLAVRDQELELLRRAADPDDLRMVDEMLDEVRKLHTTQAALERVRGLADQLDADAISAADMGHETSALVLLGCVRRLRAALNDQQEQP